MIRRTDRTAGIPAASRTAIRAQPVARPDLAGDPGARSSSACCSRCPACTASRDASSHMKPAGWSSRCGLEILSCLGYVIAFLQVFERAPVRFGARVALSELAFGAAVSLGGAGSIAVGAWLLVERGGEPTRIAERSAVLFLLTSAINVITLVAGRARPVRSGCSPGPSNPWLSLVPGRRRDRRRPGLLPRRCPASASGWPPAASPGRSARCCSRPPRSIRADRAGPVPPGLADHRRDRFPVVRHRGAGRPASPRPAVVPPLATIVLAYQIGYLSNLIPIPGNIGVLDGSLVGMFVLYGARPRWPRRPPSSTTRSPCGSPRCGARSPS